MSDYISIDPDYDCSCFRVSDYRNFMAQLREEIKRAGYGVRNLKYFLTSEYGTDPNKTHRPHYHVLFFIRPDENGRMIDWFSLSKLVAKIWSKNGRTDGYPYQNANYVRNHVFSKNQNSDLLHMQLVCNYVSKYITKDSEFEKVVESRLYNIFKQRYLKVGLVFEDGMSLDDMLYYLGEDEKERCKNLRKQCNQFHRQSNGFGEDWLKYNDYDEVFKTGMISMPDKNNIIKHVPIPSYYQMKVWYDLVKDASGRAVKWELNEEGIKYKLVSVLKNLDIMKDKLNMWIEQMKKHTYYCNLEGSEASKWFDSIINEFLELKGDRPIEDFVEYLLFYKGRIKDPLWYKRSMEDPENNYATDPFEFWMIRFDPMLKYQNELKAFNNEGRSAVYGYNHATYNKSFACRFISYEDLGTVLDWKNGEMVSKLSLWFNYSGDYKLSEGYTPSLMKSRFKKSFDIDDSCGLYMMNHVVSDRDDSRWKGFDRMWSLYCEAQKFKNVMKQDTYDQVEELKKKHKNIFKRNL